MAASLVQTLQLFNSYLPQTENWTYQLLRSVPNTVIHIAAKNYLKENFYDSKFQFVTNYYDGFYRYNRQLGKLSTDNFLKKVVLKGIPLIFGTIEQHFIRYSRQNNVDLVHAHFADVGWEFRKISQTLSVPFIISFYGWDYEKLPFTQPEYRKRIQKLFQLASGFICEGNHGASILEQNGCPKEKIFIVRLGVNPREIPFVKRVKKSNQLKLLQVASFSEKKGHIHSVKAFELALKDCSNMSLTLVGDSRDQGVREEVENYIQLKGLNDKIILVDFIAFNKLYTFIKDYQVFIHPSCYAKDQDCEGGAPVVILDAQATGMPVISTFHCDIPGEVLDGKTGLLSSEKNIGKLAKSIVRFYNMDDTEYQVFSKNARKHVENFYNITNNAKTLGNIYKQIIAEFG